MNNLSPQDCDHRMMWKLRLLHRLPLVMEEDRTIEPVTPRMVIMNLLPNKVRFVTVPRRAPRNPRKLNLMERISGLPDLPSHYSVSV
jgi:hypothetical protein